MVRCNSPIIISVGIKNCYGSFHSCFFIPLIFYFKILKKDEKRQQNGIKKPET